mmetsp:Transcript_5714/g.10260  ORF Transcript_5714/g.10260 Transcript_5714/m.10260 type:complete len:274 (-) Transcript_5714:82-903(-)|eukprot:CAMPEP_0197658436 /NCGR_PEP_ID=MMETSP1338-20131121/45237_1 /TAXON_ID=43686 ORGANISM="Pelagodinium beii, Strain RCC1491" /NCGR_SAMPLE_ID=MMETSP1338 /ASSEMBLY_ACC=CAM_ASM_000754 /LENGTH=273 /DNA_ID=CAMNT_0043235027 /DNA_START=51 /DNA_END=872 /DNA_ORIENTATION=+
MLWAIIPAVLFFFRRKIAEKLAPVLGALDPQKTAVQGHLMTVVFAALYILPFEFVGLGVLKRPAYLTSLWSNVLTLIWSIKSNYGAPPTPSFGAAGFSFSGLKASAQNALQQLAPWLQKAMMGPDFHWLFFVLIFLTAYPTVFAVLIIGRRSLWSVGTYYAKNQPDSRLWKAFSSTWDKLKAREAEVLQYSTLAEILLGIWLVVSWALPTRQILTTFLYWNFLKTRYQVPRSQQAHLQAWQMLGQKVDPIVSKVPILNKPIDLVKGWFQAQQM